ncbi:tripartite tricarboxylate transporter TctB family protein [Hydrogenophaga sp.]|uniref:tripartite tricarboxylate transporter TctB family protein n=1 Tax=Hydrogenophaga sp. TaxID=1904254 RepID=UPI0027291858|nr:tripartite tricarboxylate transporter TctB family protein [Hydrogenophaga sp.]MDO8906083.1 tripartite tricarboxylate transporter TctB family protein [Hydrogenophaga sp.]
MKSKDMQDLVGGVAVTALGLFAAIYAQRYEFGDLNRMGPGYFPVALGVVLTVLGLLIAIPAFLRNGEKIHVEWKTFLLVLSSIVVFALTLKVIGLILATVLAVIVSSLADHETRWKGRIILAIGVAAITYLVFGFGLGMVLPAWPWSV